jgi:CheY-specific phosphatase CheX
MSESNHPAMSATAIVTAFESAAITALQELAQLEAFPASTMPEIGEMQAEEIVLAAINLQRSLPGAMTLVISAKVAEQLAARYLPEGTIVTAELIDDVAGEFANVMAGQAKTILKGTPYHFGMSPPVVTRAANFTGLAKAAAGNRAISLDCELGPVLLIVDLLPCPNIA